MKQALKKVTSITLALCMLLSGSCIVVQGADGLEETTAHAENSGTESAAFAETDSKIAEGEVNGEPGEIVQDPDIPDTYTVHIPISEEYVLKYDETKLNTEKTTDASKDIYLDYAVEETVAVEIIPVDVQSLLEVNAFTGTIDAPDAVEHTYENGTLSFIMPKADTEIQITVTADSMEELEPTVPVTPMPTEIPEKEETETTPPVPTLMPEDMEQMEEIAEQFVREQNNLTDQDSLDEITIEKSDKTGVYEITLTFVSDDGTISQPARKETVWLYDIGEINYDQIGYGNGSGGRTHHFRVSRAFEGSHRFEAFCIEPDKPMPETGEYTATELNVSDDVAKALYYGYGGTAGQGGAGWDEFRNMTEDQQYVITHAAAAYLYTKSEECAFAGLNSMAIELAKEFISFSESQDNIPDPSVDFLLNDSDGESINFIQTGKTLKASISGSVQTSPTVYLECAPMNTVTIYPPVNITYHELNNQQRVIQGTGDTAVTIPAGTRFYFTAPLNYDKKDYTTKGMRGDVVTKKLAAYKISNGGASQDMAVMFDEGTVPDNLASLKVEWMIQGQIKISMKDKDTGKNVPFSSACSFKDAKYQIFSDKDMTKLAATLTTEDNGEALSEMLPSGIYYVKASKAPIGYETDDTVYTANIDSSSGVTVIPEVQVKRANVSIMKYLDKNMTESELQQIYKDGLLAGIQFRFTYVDGSYVDVTTDRYGWASTATGEHGETDGLAYGKWILTELNPPEGYEGIDPAELMIDGEEKDIKYVCYNKQIAAYLKILKKDSVTGNMVKQSPAKFQILNKDGKAVSMQDPNNFGEITDVFSTDKNGVIYLPQQLEAGTYTLVEIEAPEGYVKAEPIEFKITSAQSYDDPVVIECNDTPQTGKIKVIQTDTGTGDVIGTGFQYEVKVLEDILDGSGEVRTGRNARGEIVPLISGTVVDYLTTGEDSTAISKELYTGSYVITNTASAEHYSKNKQEYPVTLTPDQTAEAVTAEVKVTNEKTAFGLIKTDSTEDKILEGITFHISSDKDKEGGNYVTDQNGKIYMTDLFHDTTYYIQEKATIPGYNLDSTVYEFHVDEYGMISGQSVYEMKLTNQPNILEISKKDISQKKELPGATLVVYDSTGKEVEKWVSKENPHVIKGLPAGDYVLHEKSAPERYSLAEDIEFTLSDSLQVEHVVMYDDLISIEVSKVDTTDGKELAGAELSIMDSDGKEIEHWTSTDEPHKLNLAAGVYTLTETHAPDKYATADSLRFEVTSENTIQKVVMKDSPIQVEISKQDLTNKEELKGAHLKIETLDGEMVEEWTSTKEPHRLNLPVGKYVLTEISAPKGYDVAESMKFEVVDTAEIQKVVMFDKPTDGKTNLTGKKNTTTISSSGGTAQSMSSGQPAASGHSKSTTASPVKTGDETPIGKYILLALLSASVILAAICFDKYAIRKNKHSNKKNR